MYVMYIKLCIIIIIINQNRKMNISSRLFEENSEWGWRYYQDQLVVVSVSSWLSFRILSSRSILINAERLQLHMWIQLVEFYLSH
jgi:hypothetical protein